MNLTINKTKGRSETKTACSAYTWRGKEYKASGTYSDTLTSATGCDSLLTLNLTINKGVMKDTTIKACRSVTYNSVTYTSDTTITKTLQNYLKCDSVVTIHIRIEKGIASVPVSQNGPVLTANVAADSYQWLDCNKGNAPIAGATLATYTAPGAGSFAVSVKLGQCLDISTCHTIFITDIENAVFAQSLDVYPNPTSNSLVVDFGTTVAEAGLELISAFGQVVLKRNVSNIATTKLDLSVYADGVYTLQVNRNGQLVYRRVLVHK